MAEKSFIDQLLLLQQIQAMQDAQRRREQQAQQQQGGQKQQQSSPMDAYNKYTQVMDMMPAAAPAYEAPAMGSTPAATSAFGGASELGGTSGVGAEVGTGIGGYASYAVPVLAAIAGQHLMSGETDRRTKIPGVESHGHRTGDIFSGDFFTEPWMAFGNDKLGIDAPTFGEKTDSAINSIREGESGWDNLLRSSPGTAAQWFDPVGTWLYGISQDKLGPVGKYLGKAIMPLQAIADLF